jgi:hypothetical protein
MYEVWECPEIAEVEEYCTISNCSARGVTCDQLAELRYSAKLAVTVDSQEISAKIITAAVSNSCSFNLLIGDRTRS